MAKIRFFFATMDSGKTFNLLKTAYNMERHGKKVLCFTSEVDNREKNISPDDKKGIIATRIGLQREAWLIERVDAFKLAEQERPDLVLADEVQFFDKHIMSLVMIADLLNIPVDCYGLKNDFQNKLFKGSRLLLTYADELIQMETDCVLCNRTATMNLRVVDGVPVYSGQQIAIGKTNHLPTCRKCYHHPDTDKLKQIWQMLNKEE